MLKLSPRLWVLISVIGAVLLSSYVVLGSAHFQSCIEQKGASYEEKDQAAHKEPKIVLVGSQVDGARLYVRCTTRVIVKYNAGITAVSTLLLFFITGALAWLAYRQDVTSRAQLRAYLYPDGAEITEGSLMTPSMPNHFGIPGFSVVFKNSGQTPAFRVVQWREIAVADPSKEHTFSAPVLVEKQTNTIGAGGVMPVFKWFDRPLTQSEIQDVSAGVKFIFFYGRIEYTTLGIRRHTNFRMFYRGTFPPQKGWAPWFCESGNDAN